LLTRRTDVPGFEAGRPFEVDFSANSAVLRRLTANDSGLSERALIETLVPGVRTPGLRAWGDNEANSLPYAVALEWILGSERHVELGEGPVSASRYRYSEFSSSDSSTEEWSVIATPEDFSFRRLPASVNGGAIEIVVPIALTVDFSDRPSITLYMRDGPPP